MKLNLVFIKLVREEKTKNLSTSFFWTLDVNVKVLEGYILNQSCSPFPSKLTNSSSFAAAADDDGVDGGGAAAAAAAVAIPAEWSPGS